MKHNSKTLKRYIPFASMCLIIVIVAVIFGIIHEISGRPDITPEEIRAEKLLELEESKGQYNEQTIVLKHTTEDSARYLAEMTGAKLRITKDGSYATLTLKDGQTLKDVISDDSLLDYISDLSLDYYTSVCDMEESEEAVLERYPTRPVCNLSDELFGNQSNLDYLNLTDVMNRYSGTGVTVAVIDTGIDTDHPEFAGKISEWSYNASEDKIVKDYKLPDGGYDWSIIEDEHGHGTAVAGVIGAGRNNGGIAGIANNATLLVIKAECDASGRFLRTSDLVFGLYYAIERDVDVINMSFGGEDNEYAEAAKLAVDSDILCVAAAGNDSTASLSYPAADPNVIGVGALSADSYELAAYSNFGENSDIVAPGTTYTAKMGGGYRTVDGTSLASPEVAAALALLKQKDRRCDFDTAVELLYASSYDLGSKGEDWYYGYGALDITALLLEERGKVTFNYLTDEIDETEQIFIRNHTLQDLPEPERNYCVFDGWYYDIYCTEEVQWYEDIWTQDLTLYASWCNEDDGVPYTYVTLDDGTVEIRSYTGRRKYITIPEMIDEKPVSSIGDFAFSEETKLRTVRLPSSLTRIGDSAFLNCAAITSIEIPEGVRYIGDNAFAGAISLHDVVFSGESQLNQIGNYAFANTGLSRFSVPKDVEVMKGTAFLGASRMMAYSVDAGNTMFSSEDGVLYNRTKSTIVAFPAGLTAPYDIPDSVNTIGEGAFAYSKLSSIDLNGILSIKGEAFKFSALEEIEIPDSVTLLDDESFYGCEYLRKVSIGHGLGEIKTSCFEHDNNLSSVTISNTIQKIGKGAFAYCGIGTLIFEENSDLIEIGEGSFYGASALTTVTIPKSVLKISDKAFSNVGTLSEIVFEDGSNLKSIGIKAFYNASSLKNIDLPEKLVSIGDQAFAKSGLEGTVTIPELVSDLKNGPFAYCIKLKEFEVDEDNTAYKSVNGVLYSKDDTILVEFPAGHESTSYTIPDGVTAIGNSAFYGAEKLSSLTLSESLEEIRENALYGCISIKSLQIPDNVIQISRHAFRYTDALRTVTFSDNSKLSRISYGAFADSGISSIRIPASITSISQNSFEGCTYLTDVTFAAGSRLESISAYQFIGADNLTSVRFEDGSMLKHIQAHAFENAQSLVNVDFGDAGVNDIDNYAFRYCPKLENLALPETVTSIGRYAFYGDDSLVSLVLPETVTYIGSYAFYTRDSLIDLFFAGETLPLSLQENWDEGIHGYTLGTSELNTVGDFDVAVMKSGNVSILKYNGSSKTVDLTDIDLGGEVVSIGGYAFFRSEAENIILPESLLTIEPYAFAYSKISQISIPDSVSFIGKYAFYHSDLLDITIPETGDLTKIEKYAFAECGNLQNVTIPTNVNSLGSFVFYKSGLHEVTFADGINLSEIPESAFASTHLETVVIPDSVEIINNNAFRDNMDLESVSFGSGVSQIMANVFYNTGLKSVNISENISYIGEYAFNGLKNLTCFEVAQDNGSYKSVDGVLFNKDGKKLISVPAGLTGRYTIPATVETIGFGAFENSSISEVIFGEGINLLTIGYRAFYNADSITSITIPSSVVSVDYYGFAECDSLKSIIFEEDNHLSGIYEGAFYGCGELEDITLPDSIEEISDYAFYGCENLGEIPVSEDSEIKEVGDYSFSYSGIEGELIVPDTIWEIGEYAFRGTGVTSLTIPSTQSEYLIIGIGAFNDCNDIVEVNLPFCGDSLDSDINWFGWIFGAGSKNASSSYVPEEIENIIIQYGPEGVNGFYFGNTQNLKTLRIADGTKIISGFDGCENLTRVEIPYGVTQIDDLAFKGCTNLEEIVIPDSVKIIGGSAFSECTSLTSINIPVGVTTIYASTFHNCCNLTNIILPDSVTEIMRDAFYGCSKLEHINIPDGVTSIGIGAFDRCSSLTEITIPSSVTSIGSSAFYDCSILASIDMQGDLSRIEDYTFNGCCSLEAISIPAGVTNIGNSAFNNCNSLTEIVLPNGVTSIGDNAFSNCSSLTNINIPEGVTSVGYSAFGGCSSLISISIPDGVTSIGSSAFGGCSSLEGVNVPSGITQIGSGLFSYCTGISSVEIPDSVTIIGSNAFIGCSNLTTITIPDSVTEIRENAFRECSSLVSVELPSELTAINANVFDSCSSLSCITMPDNLSNIGNRAFFNCNSLASIEIPSSVTSIDEYAFSGCTNLFIVKNNSDLVLSFGSTDNGYVAYYAKVIEDKDGNIEYHDPDSDFAYVDTAEGFRFVRDNGQYTLIGYLGTEETVELPEKVDGNEYKILKMRGVKKVIIPEGITSIDSEAFRGCSTLTDITIPGSVTSIGDNAFTDCANLSNINISEGVETIGYYAFSGCTSLKNITIPNGVETIGYYAFSKCTALESASLPDTVTNLGRSAFEYCSSLKTVNIPRGVTSIFNNEFYNCSGLASITIPSTVSSLNAAAFSGCSSLMDIVIESDNPYYFSRDGVVYDKDSQIVFVSPAVTDIVIPDEVTSIKSYAFQNCSNLKSVYIPDSVTSIESHAFQNCIGLTEVNIPDGMTSLGSSVFWGCSSLAEITIPNSMTKIPDHLFYNCSSLEAISVPDSVTEIGSSAFAECSNLLGGIELPEGLTSIGSGAFAGCTELDSITIPDTVSYFGNGAFARCSGLTSIHIPEGVKKILYSTFSGCTGLTEVTIPNSVGSIEYNAFLNCSNLKKVSILGPVMSIGYSAFEGCSNLAEINIPAGVTSIGYTAFKGCCSLEEIVIPDSVTNIGYNAFQGCSSLSSASVSNSITNLEQSLFSDCTSLASVNIPSSASSIGNWVFSGCKSLTNIVIPDGVTKIGWGAFSGCSSLTEISIPDSVTSIDSAAFQNCSGLERIVLPDGITSIGSMFEGCSSLEEIVIPNSVTNIGYNAFYGCSSLEEIVIPDSVTSIEGYAFSGCNSLRSIEIPDGVTSIGDRTFYYCKGLMSVSIPDSVTSIGSAVFESCSSLEEVTIPAGVTSIGDYAFYNCDKLYLVHNNSNLPFVIGSSDNGYVAYNAKAIEEKNGNIEYRNPSSEFAYVDTDDGFRFIRENGQYTLIGYFGSEDTVVLPESINGSEYSILEMRGVRNVIIPDGITNIGFSAFRECRTLTGIDISDSVNEIAAAAFEGCSKLTDITIPDSVTTIGDESFLNSAYYNDKSNWDHGALYIGNHLIRVSEDSKSFEARPNTVSYSHSAFRDCYSLTSVKIGNAPQGLLSDCSNIEQLYLTGLPEYSPYGLFYGNVPLTLKTVVLDIDDYTVPNNLFWGVTNVSIYVNQYKEDVMWDNDSPSWSNGNKVFYKGKWINAQFYDTDGNLISSEYYSPSQIIRQPYVAPVSNDATLTVLDGWDLDGDGARDTVPATSAKNITAVAVMKTVDNIHTIRFIDKNGDVLESQKLIHGTQIVPPADTDIFGYAFIGWKNYSEGMTADEDMDILGEWEHVGDGHEYVLTHHEPDCTHEGYDIYICSACGESYKDNTVPALGHSFGDWETTEEPECEKDGLRRHTCDCGFVEEEAIPAHGHKYIAEVTEDADCEHTGSVKYVCSYCEDQVFETTPITSHHYEKYPADITFLEWLDENLSDVYLAYEDDSNGYYYRCAQCGHIRTADESGTSSVASVANVSCKHKPGSWENISDPIGTSTCVKGRYCTLCDDLLEVRVLNYNDTQHIYGDANGDGQINGLDVVRLKNYLINGDATSSVELSFGSDANADGKADELDVAEIIEYLAGYIYEEPAGIPESDHTAEGPIIKCENVSCYPGDTIVVNVSIENNPGFCYLELTPEYSDKLTFISSSNGDIILNFTEGNQYIWVSDENTSENGIQLTMEFAVGESVEPGEYSVGFILRGCVNADELNETCEIIFGKVTVNCPHVETTVHPEVAPTCLTKGNTEYTTCDYCGSVISGVNEEIPALGHDLVHHDAKAATCTEIGWEAYDTCTRCDYTTYVELPALNHDLVHHDAKAATCTEIGWEAYDTCTRCDYTTYVELPALNHDLVHHDAKAATCTEIGWEAYDTCTRCDYTTYVELPALDHDLVHHDAKAATCTEIGWEAYDTCTRCDYTTYVELPALNHDLEHHDAKAATCTEIGWEAYDTCTRCDYTTYVELPALGHEWSEEWTVDKEADYENAGSKSHHCVRCDDKTDETEIPKLEITVDSSKMFKDVKATSWFKGAVDYAVEKGLMNGVTEDTFNPNGSMTRAMLVTVLWRLEGEPASTVKVPFTDLKQAWYKDAVAWAYENEIVNGTSADKFSPNGAITREQMAAILFRFSEYKGYDISSRGVIKNFPDAGKVHSYAEDALSWAVGEELIGGVAKDGKTYLDPRGSATRAQVATILQRFCEKH